MLNFAQCYQIVKQKFFYCKIYSIFVFELLINTPSIMKKIALLLVIMFSITSFGKSIEPKLEIVGNLVKATYYHDNGAVQQEGFFKDGKLDGKWTSYEVNGNIKSIAMYNEGVKSGKWVIDTKEVVYNNNEVVSVNKINAIAKN